MPGPQLCQPRPIPLTGPGAARSPARPAASRTPSIVKDTPCDGCPHCWSPLASQETFCYLQDEAKSLVRLKIPSDRTPFGGCPRQTEHNLHQPPVAQAARSCQPARRRPSAAQHQQVGVRGTSWAGAPGSPGRWATRGETACSQEAVGGCAREQRLAAPSVAVTPREVLLPLCCPVRLPGKGNRS